MKRGNGNGDDGGDDKGTKLVIACRDGLLDDVKRLVDEGVSLNREYRNEFGMKVSPLRDACVGDRLEVVRFLLDSGADPNYGEKSPLCKVCYKCSPNCLAIAQLLLEHGADVNIKYEHGDWTPLMLSFIFAEPPKALLELLIRKGADVNAVNNEHKNALYWAVNWSNVDGIFLLLENGSEVVGSEQEVVKFIVEKNQDDVLRMVELLRIVWERGVREIKDKHVRDNMTLPPWNADTHWIYRHSFHERAGQFMLVWNRVRREYGLPREIGLMIVKYMALDETKTVYHGHL